MDAKSSVGLRIDLHLCWRQGKGQFSVLDAAGAFLCSHVAWLLCPEVGSPLNSKAKGLPYRSDPVEGCWLIEAPFRNCTLLFPPDCPSELCHHWGEDSGCSHDLSERSGEC